MIIVKIKGGLGNQLFQYALARKIAYIKNTIVKLDIAYFENDLIYKRKFELSNFNITQDIATPDEVKEYIYRKFEKGLPGFTLKIFDKLLPYYKRRIVTQNKKGFDPIIINVSDNSYLDGYWGDERYFKDILNILYQELTLKGNLDDNNLEILNKIQSTNSVSIHVRRNDYIKIEEARNYFAVCGTDYYSNAIKYICNYIDNPVFFIFSDDYTWVKENLNINQPHVIVRNNEACKDLILMKNCKNHIIANSTFSWWGAWLNPNLNKIVIAPKLWYRDVESQIHYENEGLVPNSWIKL